MKNLLIILVSMLTIGCASSKKALTEGHIAFTEECKNIKGSVIEIVTEQQIEELAQNGEDLIVGDHLVDITGDFVNMITKVTVVSTAESDANKRLLEIAGKHFTDKAGYEFIAEASHEEVDATIRLKEHSDDKYEMVLFATKGNQAAVCIIFSKNNLLDTSSYVNLQ